MAKKLEHLENDDLPSFKKIAEKLKYELYKRSGEPDEWGQGSVLTFSYGEFYYLTERAQLRKRLYTEVELEASRLGILVAFGWNAVVVTTDDNFAQEGWSSFTSDETYWP